MSLPEQLVRWIDGAAFATLGTVDPDGRPQLSVVWLASDGDDLLVSTVRGRRKTGNLERDPRATVLVVDPANPYAYVEVRGSVTLSEEGGRELIDRLSERYTGTRPYQNDPPDVVRVVVRIRPEHVVERG